MITMQEFMEVVEYRITEGSDFTWDCFGKNSRPYSLSAWNGEHDGWSFCITFDTGTQEVYVAEACDYRNDRAYRLFNPKYKDAYMNHGNKEFINQAWDDVEYVDLEVDDDWIQKALAIRDGEDYDTRVSVPLDLGDDELFRLMKMAHERDLTLNEFVEDILREAIERHAIDSQTV